MEVDNRENSNQNNFPSESNRFVKQNEIETHIWY